MNAPITTETQLNNLLDYAEELAQYKADYRGKPQEFGFTREGLLSNKPSQSSMLDLRMAPVALTDHAVIQAYGKLGAAYSLSSLGCNYLDALRAQEPVMFATCMNHAIERMPADRKWLVRTYQDTCRAVLSDEYLIFDNKDMLRLLNDVLEKDGTPHRISTRSFVNPDNMVADVLFKEVNTNRGNGNDGFSLGVRIRNGEIGNWQGGVYPIIKRTSCDNSIAVDDRTHSFIFKHAGHKTMSTKRVMLKAAIGEILPFSVNIVERLIEAEETELPRFSDVVNGLGFKHGWSEAFIGAVFAGSEARYSLAGLVNGVTYAAHTQQANQEHMTDMEFLGGALLFDDKLNLVREAEHIYSSRAAREAAREARRSR